MPVSAVSPVVEHIGNGVTTVFPYGYKILANADMTVWLDDVLQTGGYTVSGAGVDAGGNVTFSVAPAASVVVRLQRVVSLARTTDYQEGGAFRADQVDIDQDKQTMQIQQVNEEVSRALKFPPGSPPAAVYLPTPEPLKFLGWDQDASAVVNYDPADFATLAATSNWNYKLVLGDGTAMLITLDDNPGVIANLDISIGGVTQTPVIDYTISGKDVQFIGSVPLGEPVLIRYGTALSQGYIDQSAVIGSADIVRDYAAAAAYSGDKDLLYVLCRSTVGDGGHGYFDHIKTTAGRPAANGGTILHTSDGWLRRVVGDAYLTSWFGVDNTATQAAIDAAYGGIATVLINTHQTWTAPVTVKNGIKLRGLGVDVMGGGGTKITYTGTTDALVIANPVDGSTSANIDIEGIWFSSNSLANNCGMIFDTASSVLKIRKCRFNSKIGIILDQTEISDIYDCSFAFGDGIEHMGIWLVNGADKNPGASAFFTNRISVKGSEFNGGPGSVCIRDDGGVSHVFEDNNYNASGYHIIATAVNSLRITGGEYEENSEASIVIGLTKKNGGIGAKCNTVSIRDTFYYNGANVAFVAGVSGSIGHLELVNNHINCPGVVLSGLASACDSIHAEGNRQVGAGDGNTLINNYYDQVVATTAWGSSGTAPSIGNGTLSAVKSRKGREVTYRLSLLFGSTTASGTGEWSFGLPHPANTLAASFSVGSVAAVISGTSGYAMAASLSSDGTSMRINPTSPTPNAGAGVPATWTAGSYIHAQISYEAAALI